MDNVVKGNQSELPERKPPPKKTGLSKEDTIPLHPIAREGTRNRERYNVFYYQRGKTKFKSEGNTNKAIRLALIDTVCKWIIRVLLIAATVYSAHAAKQMLGNEEPSTPKKPHSAIQKYHKV